MSEFTKTESEMNTNEEDNVDLAPLGGNEAAELARKQRKIIGGVRDGLRTVSVPLSDDERPEYALIYEESWSELLALGMTPHLSKDALGRPQVWLPKERRKVPVAWLVADSTSDEEVTPIDGDVKNLLTDNLLIRSTRKPTRYRDLLSTEYGRSRPVMSYVWEPK